MPEMGLSGSEGGVALIPPSLPLSKCSASIRAPVSNRPWTGSRLQTGDPLVAALPRCAVSRVSNPPA